MYSYIPSSIIVTMVSVGVTIVNAPSGLMSEIDTEKVWFPSNTSSAVVGIVIQLLRGNVLPSLKSSVNNPPVKSFTSDLQSHVH